MTAIGITSLAVVGANVALPLAFWIKDRRARWVEARLLVARKAAAIKEFRDALALAPDNETRQILTDLAALEAGVSEEKWQREHLALLARDPHPPG